MPNVIPFAETRQYVTNILARAGTLPMASPEETLKALLPHVIHQESGGNPNAVSRVGARGVLQTMPATLRDPGFGVAPAKDDSPEELKRVGSDYLLAMLKRYPGRVDMALAAYNAGPGRADKWIKQGIAGGGAPATGTSPYRASAGLEFTTQEAEGLGELPGRRPDGENFLSNVVGLDSSIAAISRAYQDANTPIDPNFELGQLDDKEWAKVTQGIPQEYWESLAGAGSRAHLDIMAERLRANVRAEQELAGYGGWGVAGRLAVNLLDPLSVAVGVASGGFGYGAKAAQLARAARVARLAGRFEDSAEAVAALKAVVQSAGRGSRIARSAALAAGENAGIQAVIDYGDPTKDGWDVAQAGLFGAVLGGAGAKIFGGSELRRIQRAYLAEAEATRLGRLNYELDLRKADIEAKIASFDSHPDTVAARTEVESLQRKLAGLADERESQLRAKAPYADDARLAAAQDEWSALSNSRAAEVAAEVAARRGALAGTRKVTKADLAAIQKEAEAAVDAKHAPALKRLSDRIASLRESAAARDTLASFEAGGRNPAHLLGDTPDTRALAEAQAALARREAEKVGLQSQLKGTEDARAAGVDASNALTGQESTAFGKDTASAARFNGFDEGVHPHLEGKDDLSGLPVVGKMALAEGVRHGPLATFAGILRGSGNEKVRTLLGRLVGSATGNADHSLNTVGASEVASRINQSMTAKFYSAAEPAYADWAKRNGIGMIQMRTRAAREKFMAAVGKAVRSDDVIDDPAVAKLVPKVREIFNQYLREAKDAGIKGFEDVEPNPHYLPRVFDFHRQAAIEADIGTANLESLIAGAIRASNEDVSEELAGKLGRAYLKRMKELRVGSDVGAMQGLRWDDVGFLRQFLHDAGTAPDEIESVVNEFARLNAERARQTEGSFRNAKKRAQFDENFSMKFRSQNAAKAGNIEDVTVSMADLLENNVEALFGRYTRSVSGHIGLAKVGIKSKGDFDNAIHLVERELAGEPKELERVKKTANVAYKLITGAPIEDATTLTRFGRFMRDWNFATTMNQAGWSQVPDMAGMLSKGYLKHTLGELFGGDFMRYFKRTDGSLDIEGLRELEEWIGVGTDFHNNTLFSSYDPGEELGLEGAFGKAEHAVRVAGRGTQVISGMAWMTSFAQRMVARGIVQRITKEALSGGEFSAKRLATLGLDDAMLKRIKSQIKAHTEFVDGNFGGKVKVNNWAKWDDVDARDAMLTAVHREARRLVQEEDIGDTTRWMHTSLGKIVLQFRRFALVSYSKQLLHGIAHRDAETASHLAISSALAAMAYKARHEVNVAMKQAGGADDEEIKKYREKYLTDDRLVAAAIANSSYASLLPALWDTTSMTLTGTRFFDTRASGLGSDFLSGNPTVTGLHNAGQALGGAAQAMLRGDREFTQQDAQAIRRLFPYQNALGVEPLVGALTRDLPEKQQDDDPQKVDWFLKH